MNENKMDTHDKKKGPSEENMKSENKKTQTELTPLQQIIHSRRSIRRFLDKPVEREKIKTCLESARRAPSADNVQPWRFLVVDDPDIKNDFARAAFSGLYSQSKWAFEAPVLIIILSRPSVVAHQIGQKLQKIDFQALDLGIAGEHLVLQAEELGLGTCWMGWFDPQKARRFFKIPRKYKIVSLLAMGYYEKKPGRVRKLKPLEEIAWFNKVGE